MEKNYEVAAKLSARTRKIVDDDDEERDDDEEKDDRQRFKSTLRMRRDRSRSVDEVVIRLCCFLTKSPFDLENLFVGM